jgi:hypothetical protein
VCRVHSSEISSALSDFTASVTTTGDGSAVRPGRPAALFDKATIQ